MITKAKLNELVVKYENSDFIKKDPIQFIYKGKYKEDKEIMGFIASAFAFGNRKAFINTLNQIFCCCDNDICNYVKNGDFKNLKGLYYRIYKDSDIIGLFHVLHNIYTKEGRISRIRSSNSSK